MKFEDILREVVPDFAQNEYRYDYWEGDYQYYHNTNEEFIDGDHSKIEIVEKGTRQTDYDEDWFIVFKYNDKFYYLEYQEGSQGMNYKINEDTFKEVTAKTKEVIYYE